MMKKIYFYMAAASLCMALTGCSDDKYELSGEGTLQLRATINRNVEVVSRAVDQDELSEKAIIWISQVDKGVVRKYQGIDNIPVEGIKLASGQYVAEVWTGDSASASFDKIYFKGRTPFTVENAKTAQVNVECRIANTVVSVDYAPEIDEVLRDYTFTVEHTRGALTFEGRDERKGYFMMPSNATALTYTLTGTKMTDGSQFTRTGVIADVKPTTEYVVSVKCGSDDTEIGGAFLTIQVDEEPLDEVGDDIVIATAPVITGYGFDITQPVTGEMGTIGRRSMWITASSALTSVVLESSILSSNVGLSGNDIDVMRASQAVKDQLAAGGITIVYEHDPTLDISRMKISLEASLTNALPNGDYNFTVTATDSAGKRTTTTLVIMVSDAPLLPVSVADNDVNTWPTRATISAQIVKDGVSNPGFDYREVGTSAWSHVDAVMSRAEGQTITAQITGLKPGTRYEFRPTCDGFTGAAVGYVTTEPAIALTNGGFEEWDTSKTPYMLSSDRNNFFWDSGNHGSAKMKKNLTTPDADIKHSGNYSVKMHSQYVGLGTIGKFAAGNCFIGSFLGTENTTDGILGWGRPFASRPAKLKGYLRYRPVPIDRLEANAPAEYKLGDMDRGMIFIALLDNSTSTFNGNTWPMIIRTNAKAPELFNKDAANVIAYGEYQVEGNLPAGDGFIEFEIPLDYKRTDVKVANIMITCAASKGGDYFTGGDGTIMWVDDLELVY